MRSEGKSVVSKGIEATATSLRVDTVTAATVARLREAGIRAILLKGPALAVWLYGDGTARRYIDSDLLVAPETLDAAEEVLRSAGFRPGQPSWRDVSRSWSRQTDGASVDLHRSLFGIGISPGALWRTLSNRTQPMRVGGAHVDVLSQPALAMHVALHAVQHGGEGGQPLSDLDRALAIADVDCWRMAATLAGELHAVPAFASGLRLRPRGTRLAETLQLPVERPTAIALHADGTRPLVLGLEHLATTPGLRPRLAFVGRKVIPSAKQMRWDHQLARRGRLGLALSYCLRPFVVVVQLPAAIITWLRARMAARRLRSAR